MTDYEAIRSKILDLCNKAGICYEVNPRNEGRTEVDEIKGSPLKFHVWLTVSISDRALLKYETDYTAGVGIADSDLLARAVPGSYAQKVLRDPREHRTVDGVTELRCARRIYRPTVVDVVSALVVDASFANEHDSWEEMAVESGADTQSVDSLRKAQRDFLACKEAARFLARAFRSNMETLTSLCREL